ncbi:hypothetical protein IVB34_35155 [Bradyrhizobium sp. 2]|nr:hypothetical protein [Bradyrhizobium sp. 2]MCK1463458.1 hypothetical protein [Bradyrhizobium sp. 2]
MLHLGSAGLRKDCEGKRSFLEVTGDVVEHVDPIFFGDPKTAAFKALGLN